MKKYDVIIVGGGPAGIGAAKILEVSTFTFCLIDKNKFPRPKLCGGGLTGKCQNILKKLKLSIDNISKYDCNNVKIISKDITKEVELIKKIIMVDRNEFDYNNVKQLKCEIFQGENVISIEDNILITDKDKYEFKYIIFADGINGYSRKLVENREFGFCLEYDVNQLSSETIFDFSVTKGGYGWVFPKKTALQLDLLILTRKKLIIYLYYMISLKKTDLKSIKLKLKVIISRFFQKKYMKSQ